MLRGFMFFFILFLQGLAFGGFCAYLAGQKNRDGFGWFLLGFFFSILALIAIAASPNLAAPQDANSNRKCPYCAEMVKTEAKICRFCQHELPSSEKSDLALPPLSEEEIMMKRYNILKEGGRYMAITYSDGLFCLEKKHFFPSLKEAVKTMHNVDI